MTATPPPPPAADESENGAAVGEHLETRKDVARTEFVMREYAPYFTEVFNHIQLEPGRSDDEKRKLKDAWQTAYYASGVRLQVIAGTDVMDMVKQEIEKTRADADAWFAEHYGNQHPANANTQGE